MLQDSSKMKYLIKIDRVKSTEEITILRDMGISLLSVECEGVSIDERSKSIEEVLEIVLLDKIQDIGVKINPRSTSDIKRLSPVISSCEKSFIQIDYNYLCDEYIKELLKYIDACRIYVEGVSIDCDESLNFIENQIKLAIDYGIEKYIIGLYPDLSPDWSEIEDQVKECDMTWDMTKSLIERYELLCHSNFQNFRFGNPANGINKINLKLGHKSELGHIDINAVKRLLE